MVFPVLFEIPVFGGLRIYTYGVLVALAFLIGIFWTTREARPAGVAKEKIFDLSFYIVLGALVGSRIFYILTHMSRYARTPLEIFKIWEGGLVFYGGFLGAVVAIFLLLRKYRLKFLPTADLFSPGLALGHAVGRLGCFAAGCCHGREALGISWSVTFPDLPYSLAPAGIPLYPTQIMESLAALAIFISLILVRRRGPPTGRVFAVYLLGYGLLRFLLEPFRGGSARDFVGGSRVDSK